MAYSVNKLPFLNVTWPFTRAWSVHADDTVHDPWSRKVLPATPLRTGKYVVEYYSTDLQIVSCTLSGGSVLSESNGLSNRVLLVSQWNIFSQKKISQPDCVFQPMLGQEDMFPPPLGGFRLFEDLVGALLKKWHFDMIFLDGINMAPKCNLGSLLW